ncbi:UNVERIFIED_ORG: hypothetical protein QFZ59_003616 [Bacillus sp. B2I3]|nr:hypothetical protein [Bacillus sp. B2I3]
MDFELWGVQKSWTIESYLKAVFTYFVAIYQVVSCG